MHISFFVTRKYNPQTSLLYIHPFLLNVRSALPAVFLYLQPDEHLLFAKLDYECRVRGANNLAYLPVVAGQLRYAHY